MKTTTAALLTCTVLLMGCATPHQSEHGDTVIKTDNVRLVVHGLSCPLCSNNLDGVLEKIEGVEEVAIDLKTGSVDLRLSRGHRIAEAQLAEAVAAAGFSLVEIKPLDNAL